MKKIFTLLCVISMTMFAANAQATFGTKAGVDFSKITISAKGLGANISSTFHTGYYFGGTAALPLGDFSLQGDLLYNFGGATISASEDFIKDAAYIAGGIIGRRFIDDDDQEEFEDEYENFIKAVNGRMAARLNISTITLPITLKYNITDEFAVMAGPYISYRIATKIKLNSNLEDMVMEMTGGMPSDVLDDILDEYSDVVDEHLQDLDYGIICGAEYQFANGLFIDGRYSLGLSNMLDIPKIGDIEITAKTQSFKIGLGYRF